MVDAAPDRAVTNTTASHAETGAPGFVRKGLLRLSWPLLVVTVVTLLATLGNVVLLSMSSPELNAAVSTANQTLGVLYDISVLFSIGALVIIAQRLGAGDGEGAQRTVVVALRASAVLGAALAVGIAALGPLVLTWINTPADIYDDALAYLWVVAGGLWANTLIVTATAVLRGYGRTPALLVLGIIVNILDVALLFVCLFVLELGAVGAAIPTLVVRAVGVLILWWMVRRWTGARVFAPLPEGTATSRRASSVRTLSWLSVPTVVESFAYNGAIVIAVVWINLLGTDSINARSYALTLTALVTGVILALAQGNETIVGWDVGARERQAAKRGTLRTVAWTAGASALLAFALWAAAEPALSIFGPNEAVLAGAKDALLVSVVLLPLSALTTIVYGALRSAGDVWVPMAISVAASLIVLVPLSWLFISELGLGIQGAFWALVVTEAVRGGLLLWRWLGDAWVRPPVATDTEADAPLVG